MDFTPWLAMEENLALLGESLGIALELDSVEKSVGPFSADILCRDPINDHWVLIENQLEQTDHTHLGQIITYAAGLDAVTIVWIASRFVEQHRAALDWLNEITAEGTNFFGLEIELWRIGDGTQLAPKFNVVSKPNAWSKQVPRGPRETRTWDEPSFFAALAKREPRGVEPARAILEWGKERMPHLWWGSGLIDGSVYLGRQVGPDLHYLLSLWTGDRVEFLFERMKTRPVFESEEKRLRLLHMLNEEVGLHIPDEKVGVRPSVPLAQFTDPAKLEALLHVLDWYVDEITATEA